MAKAQVNTGRVLPDLSNTIPGSATKPTPRSAQVRDSLQTDPLARYLKEMADPYMSALDEPGRNGFTEGEAGDSGHTKPSVEEKNFKFFLIHNLTYLNRQLNGPITIDEKDSKGEPTGRKRLIPSMRERCDASEKLVYADNFEPSEEASVKALYWLEVNLKQLDWLTTAFNSFSNVYREIYREDWKAPVVKTKEEKAVAVQNKGNFEAVMARRAHLMAQRNVA
jgi:hypothetical protein